MQGERKISKKARKEAKAAAAASASHSEKGATSLQEGLSSAASLKVLKASGEAAALQGLLLGLAEEAKSGTMDDKEGKKKIKKKNN